MSKPKPFDPEAFALAYEARVARSKADYARSSRLAALKAAVVEANMRAYHAGWQGVDFAVMDAACAALTKAEAAAESSRKVQP